MKAHVQGSGAMAYPEQDPKELRATIIREGFERIASAIGRLSSAQDRYTSAAIRGSAQDARQKRKEQQDAAYAVGRILRQVEAQCLEIADGAEVVTDLLEREAP